MSSAINTAQREKILAALNAFANASLPHAAVNLLNALGYTSEKAAIVAQFERKNAGNLFSGRGGRLADASKQVKHTSDFDLITWLVIK